MILENWFAITVILLCLLLSFFFSASETALTTFSRARMLRAEQNGSRRAAIVNRLIETRERMIGAILTGNNIVNITAAALTTGVLISWFGDIGVLYAAAIMIVLIAVFTEALPKAVAINAPDRIALIVARPIGWVVRVLGPLLVGIELCAGWILKLAGFRLGHDQAFLSANEEMRGAVDPLHREGGVEKQDRDMAGDVLDLSELAVSDVMVHRTEMVTINADDPPEEIVRQVLASKLTRVPIWRGKPENIVGILHVKDLLRVIRTPESDLSTLDVTAIALPAWFVPEQRPLSEQLKAFRRRKTHFALVVDEYGEVMGLVTLEDILGEIVGDISDERDVAVSGVRPQPDGSVNVDGAVPIRDLNRAMDWSLPDEEATTIAGLVIHEARSIPDVGQSFTFHGFRFQVLRRRRNRITALKITPVTRPALAKAS